MTSSLNSDASLLSPYWDDFALQRVWPWLSHEELKACRRVCKRWRLWVDQFWGRSSEPLKSAMAFPQRRKEQEYKVIHGDSDSRQNLCDLYADLAFGWLHSHIKTATRSIACIVDEEKLVYDPTADRYQLSKCRSQTGGAAV